jgi:hypothetical protein
VLEGLKVMLSSVDCGAYKPETVQKLMMIRQSNWMFLQNMASADCPACEARRAITAIAAQPVALVVMRK